MPAPVGRTVSARLLVGRMDAARLLDLGTLSLGLLAELVGELRRVTVGLRRGRKVRLVRPENL